jgi:hydrogenase nickel incorporation protein HypA/HybF
MHELSVTQSLLDLALRHAGGQRITDIHMEVGAMAGVVATSVEFYFEHLSQGSLAEGARLHFEAVPLKIVCQACGQALDLTPWAGDPPQAVYVAALGQGCACGSQRLRVADGAHFRMTSIEVSDT